MMYKGLVFQVAASYIIVHCDDGRYLKLKKKKHIEVGSYIAFFEKDIIKANTKKVMTMVSLAAILLIAFIVQPILLPSRNVYAIVSMDSLSSIEYAIDDEGNVIDMNAFNDKGDVLLDNTYIGMSITDVIKDSISRSIELGYIYDDENVLISETLIHPEAEDYRISQEILQGVLSDKTLSSLYLIRPTQETVAQAKENDVSIGRMYLANEIVDLTSESVEDILDESLTEMLDKIDDSLEELKKIDKVIEETTDEVHNALDKVQSELEKLDKIPFLKDVMEEVNDELDVLDQVLDDVESELPSVEGIIDEVKSNLEEAENDE